MKDSQGLPEVMSPVRAQGAYKRGRKGGSDLQGLGDQGVCLVKEFESDP